MIMMLVSSGDLYILNNLNFERDNLIVIMYLYWNHADHYVAHIILEKVQLWNNFICKLCDKISFTCTGTYIMLFKYLRL